MAVAINLAYVSNDANIGSGDVVSSHGLSLTADMTGTGGSGGGAPTHTFVASALSGADGSQTANIDGSLALNIIEVNTSASLLSTTASRRGDPRPSTSMVETSRWTPRARPPSTLSAKGAHDVFDPNAPGVITQDPTNPSDGLDVIALPKEIVHGDGTPIVTGDQVKYSDGGGAPIGGLTDGTTYFVTVVSPGHFILSKTNGGTPITLDPSVAQGSDHELILQTNAGDSKVGIGASVAINLVNDTTQSGLIGDGVFGDGATLTGAGNIELRRRIPHSPPRPTAAPTAASRSIRASRSRSRTSPRQPGSAPAPRWMRPGTPSATATQDADLDSSAKGDFTSSKAGIGISLSLVVAGYQVDASSARSLSSSSTTSGSDGISFEADGAVHVNAESESAGEGETTSSDSKQSDGGGETANQKADKQLQPRREHADDRRRGDVEQHEHPGGGRRGLGRQRRGDDRGRDHGSTSSTAARGPRWRRARRSTRAVLSA